MKTLKEVDAREFDISGVFYKYLEIDKMLAHHYYDELTEEIGDLFYRPQFNGIVNLISEGDVDSYDGDAVCVFTYVMTHPGIRGFELVYSVTLAHSEYCENDNMFPAMEDHDSFCVLGFNAGDLDIKCPSTGKKIVDKSVLLDGLICTLSDDYQEFLLNASEPCPVCLAGGGRYGGFSCYSEFLSAMQDYSQVRPFNKSILETLQRYGPCTVAYFIDVDINVNEDL